METFVALLNSNTRVLVVTGAPELPEHLPTQRRNREATTISISLTSPSTYIIHFVLHGYHDRLCFARAQTLTQSSAALGTCKRTCR